MTTNSKRVLIVDDDRAFTEFLRQVLVSNNIIVEALTAGAYATSIETLAGLWRDRQLRARCRRAAEETLALAEGARRYQAVYGALAR